MVETGRKLIKPFTTEPDEDVEVDQQAEKKYQYQATRYKSMPAGSKEEIKEEGEIKRSKFSQGRSSKSNVQE